MTAPVTVFFSYSHKDEDLRDELGKHLSILKRQNIIAAWHDRQIGAGTEWASEIDNNLNSAQIILLLVSANFLASDYCWDLEMQTALDRHHAGEACVIPIILKPVRWKGAPFGKLQALPKDAKPVTTWVDPNEAFVNIANGIASAAGHISSRVVQPSPSLRSIQLTSQVQKIVPNPFGDIGQITDPDKFFNRDELLRQIFEELSKGVNLSLVGESQIGKSSVLHQVCNLGPEELKQKTGKVLKFVYLNLQWVDHDEDFYEALCDRLEIENCRGYKLSRGLQGHRTVLCLDEIEKMAWEGFTKELRSQLRGLADGRDAPLKLVVASRSPLLHLFPDSPELDSPLAGICRQLDVNSFSEETTRGFLNHRLQGTEVQLSESDIQDLWSNSQGHPAKLQRLASDFYEYLTRY